MIRRIAMGHGWRGIAIAALLALTGCAYFNTFYSAKKSFNQAEDLYERPDARATPQQLQLYDRALQGATKVVVQYPNSKWVDDAVLMMGRALLGKGDYLAAREKFIEMEENFPDSPLLDQALYYRGETYRKERQWNDALSSYDSLLVSYPRSKMVKYTELQIGKVYVAMRQNRRGIAILKPVVDRGGDTELDARLALAEAYYEVEAYDSAATQYHWVVREANSEEVINEAVMREGECLEQLGAYDQAMRLYAEWERRARTLNYQDLAKIRRGNAQALSGDIEGGINTLERLVAERRRSPMAAQALFQIGYIQEVMLDDFDAARSTYARVPEESRGSPFAQQATLRTENLVKIEELRASLEADTSGQEAAARAAFTVAEHYLFGADNPERALSEYAKVEVDYPESQYAPKAAFAGAWVLERKLEEPQAADSAWHHVAATYPETAFGQAASAFMRGQVDSLRRTDPIEPTLVSYPLTPGAQPYHKPQPKLELARGGAAAAAVSRDTTALADSLASVGGRDTGLQAFAPVVLLPDSIASDSLAGAPDSTTGMADSTSKAPADTTSTAPPDTSAAAPKESPSDTTGTSGSNAAADTSGSVRRSDAGRDTSRTPGN